MNRMLVVGIGALALAASSAQQTPSSAIHRAASPLVQVVRIIGDQYVGFKESCLLILADGQYHRETRRQQSTDGRPTGYWDPPEVFEGAIRAGDLQELREIVESGTFRAVTGTLGDPGALRSKLVFGPLGVIPHADVEIFEASIAHAGGSQVFEVFGNTTRRQLNPLRSFVRWAGEVEKRKEGRLDQAAANDCATSPAPGAGLSWEPSTRLTARPTYTTGPEYPPNERKAGHAGSVLVQAIVNADGSVGQASVKRGINPVLDQSALDAVKKWRFAPARLNGVAIAMPVNVEIHFLLN